MFSFSYHSEPSDVPAMTYPTTFCFVVVDLHFRKTGAAAATWTRFEKQNFLAGREILGSSRMKIGFERFSGGPDNV